jgi:signal transduction histidine kinase
VSHDLKNILNPLSLHLQLIQRSNARGNAQDVAESAAEMQQTLKRGVEVIERLRDFSRQQPEAKVQRVDVAKLAHEAAAIAKSRLASKTSARAVRIVEELSSAPEVLARPGEVVSAVVNLVVNAIDAMSDGGTVTVRSGASDGGAFLEVADDGPGMPGDVQARVFEPFFTTKGDEGTGLGLAMVYACMQRHGGTVSMETAPGKGARFTLWLPAAPAER